MHTVPGRNRTPREEGGPGPAAVAKGAAMPEIVVKAKETPTRRYRIDQQAKRLKARTRGRFVACRLRQGQFVAMCPYTSVPTHKSCYSPPTIWDFSPNISESCFRYSGTAPYPCDGPGRSDLTEVLFHEFRHLPAPQAGSRQLIFENGPQSAMTCTNTTRLARQLIRQLLR
jgi:hypothetical protein